MSRVPRTIRRLAERYRAAGHELYIVGGAVRDRLLGKEIADYDFATSATPKETQRLFRRTIPTGERHGTVTVLFEGHPYEVTTYRVDGAYHDHRRPEDVRFSRSLLEDLRRRDFTINAIALDPEKETIFDPFDGRNDLDRRIIRTVGDPVERFSEDALRMLRAVRFSATLEFKIAPETAAAIPPLATTLRYVAAERIRQELEKMMGASDRPSLGWSLLDDLTLLPGILPELTEDRSLKIEERGGPMVFPHLLRSCDCAPRENQLLRWAALLHDVGKPRCFSIQDGGVHFHEHDRVSAEMSVEILERLRFPRAVIDGVAHLVRHHMFGYDSSWSDAAVRRFIARVGADQVFALTALRRIDTCGKTGKLRESEEIRELEQRVHRVLEEAPPLTVRDLAIDGRRIMEILGISPGPVVGVLLSELLQMVIDDPATNTPRTLETVVRRFYEERIAPTEGDNTRPSRDATYTGPSKEEGEPR
ncbi:MAG: CCA tRNA nucleotidyltransferase [Alkalispirochaeta sp.]